MIVTTHEKESIKFFCLFSGKLKYTVSLAQAEFRDAFLMKDGNAIGVTDWKGKVIKIIKLYSRLEK